MPLNLKANLFISKERVISTYKVVKQTERSCLAYVKGVVENNRTGYKTLAAPQHLNEKKKAAREKPKALHPRLGKTVQ